MTRLTRRHLLAATGIAALAGCSSGDAGGETLSGPLDLPTADEGLPLPTTAAALTDEARSGGPSKDGIPSIDDPSFIEPDEVDFLDPGDPVFGVARDGATKAYPQKILVSHEICNDDLDGTPVSVTYCPLTGTVQGFYRGNTEFGVSGRLINANLVMYDRTTEAWWPQILATAIPGPWNENPEIRSLREFRLIWTTWEAWREQHPDTHVLSTDTGYAQNYGRDPYGSYNPRGGYYDSESMLFPGRVDDDRYHPKRVVMGARTADGAVAFLKDALREQRTMIGDLGGTPVVAVYDDRYDTGYIYQNPDEQAVTAEAGQLAIDGSTYAPDALPLSRIHTFDAMWFAWVGYYPETNVYD
ncbi:DUF3179 domain-containing protein [Halonotius roseus]|uniref:DUF3179 domain-containing protein n=1 Tax=Halonotius roseus TaxID=2511997 RepID=A0A544QPW7_9EURY|nr:DUF3179 domain-containing protein [Halonotius roseus]TQQ81479.1 DUF3179 domain-containing protein [Halonotius roseus]